MKAPEEIALIGGGILLSSGLIFGLRGQASSTLPNVSNSLASTFRNIDQTRDSANFDSSFRDAQQNHLVTGMWGSSKYYIDKSNTMHVGQGTLNGSLYDVIGDKNISLVKTLNFDQQVTAPNDSYRLLSAAKYGETNNTLAQMNNLDNIDVSHVSSMYSMFANDAAITDLDLSSWNTKNLTAAGTMFDSDSNLTNLNLANWNIDKLGNAGYMLTFDSTLRHINLSNWSNFNSDIFTDTANLNQITLDNNSNLDSGVHLPGSTWKNKDNGETLTSSQLTDGNSHPGTWYQQ